MDHDPTAATATHAERAADFATDNRLYRLLEGTLFKGLIGYTVHPLHIVALLALWIGLLTWHNTTFELVGGNYTNGLSAMAASIVLLQQTHHHREVKRLHRAHREAIDDLRRAVLPRPDARS